MCVGVGQHPERLLGCRSRGVVLLPSFSGCWSLGPIPNAYFRSALAQLSDYVMFWPVEVDGRCVCSIEIPVARRQYR